MNIAMVTSVSNEEGVEALTNGSHLSTTPLNDESQIASNILRIVMTTDPILASCILCEIQRSTNFRNNFKRFLFDGRVNEISLSTFEIAKYNCNRRTANDKLVLLLKPSPDVDPRMFRIGQDLTWSYRLMPQINIRLHLEDIFAWLSTLGGAYSSLGDKYHHCSMQAGQISLKQLRLAWTLGDALLEARSMLFVAQSLMQRGFLKLSKNIIRKQFEFSMSAASGYDTKLQTMCKGSWHRLRYFYGVRKGLYIAPNEQTSQIVNVDDVDDVSVQ